MQVILRLACLLCVLFALQQTGHASHTRAQSPPEFASTPKIIYSPWGNPGEYPFQGSSGEAIDLFEKMNGVTSQQAQLLKEGVADNCHGKAYDVDVEEGYRFLNTYTVHGQNRAGYVSAVVSKWPIGTSRKMWVCIVTGVEVPIVQFDACENWAVWIKPPVGGGGGIGEGIPPDSFTPSPNTGDWFHWWPVGGGGEGYGPGGADFGGWFGGGGFSGGGSSMPPNEIIFPTTVPPDHGTPPGPSDKTPPGVVLEPRSLAPLFPALALLWLVRRKRQ